MGQCEDHRADLPWEAAAAAADHASWVDPKEAEADSNQPWGTCTWGTEVRRVEGKEQSFGLAAAHRFRGETSVVLYEAAEVAGWEAARSKRYGTQDEERTFLHLQAKPGRKDSVEEEEGEDTDTHNSVGKAQGIRQGAEVDLDRTGRSNVWAGTRVHRRAY